MMRVRIASGVRFTTMETMVAAYKFNIGEHVFYSGGEGKITSRDRMHGICRYKVNGKLFTEKQLTRR